MSPVDAALRRAARTFRCLGCGQKVRARWRPDYSERVVDEHGVAGGDAQSEWATRCRRSGHVVETARMQLRADLLRAAGYQMDGMGYWERPIRQRGRFTLVMAAFHRAPYWRIWEAFAHSRHGFAAAPTEAEALARWDEMWSGPMCRECAQPIVGEWAEKVAQEMAARGLCHHCDAWTNILAAFDPAVNAVIDHEVYEVGEDERAIARRCGWPLEGGRLHSSYRHVLGFAGAECRIRWHDDGREVVTTNLWARGQVPEHFRGRLPDNAVFVRGEGRQ